MGENICKQCDPQGLNLEETQTAHLIVETTAQSENGQKV